VEERGPAGRRFAAHIVLQAVCESKQATKLVLMKQANDYSPAACAHLVKEVSWKFHGSFVEVSWKFHGSFPAACAHLVKEVSWKFHGSFMEVSWKFPGRLRAPGQGSFMDPRRGHLTGGYPTVEDSVPSGQCTTNNKGAIFSKGKDIKALVQNVFCKLSIPSTRAQRFHLGALRSGTRC
jgi:hypothetical protein